MMKVNVLGYDLDLKKIDGAYFFTSKERLLRGLCAANKDYDTALTEATDQMRILLKENHGIDLE